MIRSEAPFADLFEGRAADLVYLTADAADTLADMRSSDIYVVGGVVDRNRYKNLTLEKAAAQASPAPT